MDHLLKKIPSPSPRALGSTKKKKKTFNHLHVARLASDRGSQRARSRSAGAAPVACPTPLVAAPVPALWDSCRRLQLRVDELEAQHQETVRLHEHLFHNRIRPWCAVVAGGVLGGVGAGHGLLGLDAIVCSAVAFVAALVLSDFCVRAWTSAIRATSNIDGEEAQEDGEEEEGDDDEDEEEEVAMRLFGKLLPCQWDGSVVREDVGLLLNNPSMHKMLSAKQWTQCQGRRLKAASAVQLDVSDVMLSKLLRAAPFLLAVGLRSHHSDARVVGASSPLHHLLSQLLLL